MEIEKRLGSFGVGLSAAAMKSYNESCNWSKYISMVKLNASPAMLDGTYSSTVTVAARLTLNANLATLDGVGLATAHLEAAVRDRALDEQARRLDRERLQVGMQHQASCADGLDKSRLLVPLVSHGALQPMEALDPGGGKDQEGRSE